MRQRRHDLIHGCRDCRLAVFWGNTLPTVVALLNEVEIASIVIAMVVPLTL